MKIAILGAGSWDTVLALHFSQRGNGIALWSRNTACMKKLQTDRENKRGLPGFTFPDTLHVHTDLGEAPGGPELIIIATSVADPCDSVTLLKQNDAAHLLVPAACKGFEQDTGLLTFQAVKNVLLSNKKIGVLSDPNLAQELTQQPPCAIVLTSENREWIEELIPQLNTGMMRLYGSSDAVGVAVGGVVRSITTIATGLSDGPEYNPNVHAALVAHGLVEITRLAVAMDVQPKTLMRFAGTDDLVLTHTGALSRNRRVDLGLAEGRELHQVLMEISHVPESVNTTEGVFSIAAKYQIDIPITQTLFQLVRKEMAPQQVVERLMEHNARFE